jgi:AP-1 complex subunit gamma-1
VLKALAVLGRSSAEATEAMADALAKVAAAHASAAPRGSSRGRAGASTSAAIATEAATTIMAVEPVPTLRAYAVQIMANFLKQSDNNMRYVALNTLLTSSRTDLATVQRHRAQIVECVKDDDTTIAKRALELVAVLASAGNVEARAICSHEQNLRVGSPHLRRRCCFMLRMPTAVQTQSACFACLELTFVSPC